MIRRTFLTLLFAGFTQALQAGIVTFHSTPKAKVRTSQPAPIEYIGVVGPDPGGVRGWYPLRAGWWTGAGSTKAQAIRHLQSGRHAGQYDSGYLQSLTYSQLQSLHSDDHENRVKWDYVLHLPQSTPEQDLGPNYKQPQHVRFFMPPPGTCPAGGCPLPSRR